MSHIRSGILANQAVSLRIVFEDDDGVLVDPDQDPVVYVYDESFTVDDIEAEVAADVFTGLGPFEATRISVGYYEYSFTVPSDANVGAWHDLWLAERASQIIFEVFSFDVCTVTAIQIPDLEKNQLVVIELDSSIASISGLELGSNVVYTFSTKYDPLYASPELIRLELGPWAEFIPDDTINLMIHWASKEVDILTPNSWKKIATYGDGDRIVETQASKGKSITRYKLARTKFCIYDAALRLLMLPIAANAANITGGGQSKRLGDLAVSTSGSSMFNGVGLSWDQIDELKKKREEWLRVVNGGGNIMPGQSFDPSYAVKGLADPDRRRSGRAWESSEDVAFSQPSVNGKVRRAGTRRFRFTYRG